MLFLSVYHTTAQNPKPQTLTPNDASPFSGTFFVKRKSMMRMGQGDLPQHGGVSVVLSCGDFDTFALWWKSFALTEKMQESFYNTIAPKNTQPPKT